MIDFESAPGGTGQPGETGVFTRSPEGNPPAYLGSLNEPQREAVLQTEGPLIVLAGAGSGKTKMLTTRIAYLMDQLRVPGHRILAVTFTNKAAAEMKERVQRTLQSSGMTSLYDTPEIGTFHSVCVRLLRRELPFTPFTKPFVIYDDSDQLSLIKAAMVKLQIDEKSVNPKGIRGAIDRMKCDAVEPADFTPSPHNVFEKHLKRVYEQYQKDLIANNALDFGEIICMTYRVLRDNPELRAKYQHRFRYVHVDEYQDTNRAQYLFLAMLTGKGTAGATTNICVVGDEDQSIYKWRGADIHNILDFERDYPGAHVVKLEQNYRSTKTIIRAASQVIGNNRSRKDKTLWTENEEGAAIVRMQLPDERAEAELSVSEIKRLARDEGRAFGDFAIFYRTNAQSRQFEDVLRREKIPYQIVGGLRFYDRKEIKDVLSYFKAVLNPADSVSLKRIINVPGRGIGKTTLDKLDEVYFQESMAPGGAPPLTYWDVLKRGASDASITSSGTAKKIAQFVKLMERFMEEQPKLMLSELYHLILDETAYVRELREEGTDEALARIENLEEFDTLLQEFDEDNFHSIPEEERKLTRADLLALFIEQSSLASDEGPKGEHADSPASSVKLMTLHSSKGLEFPVVFIGGMEEGLFPSFKAWEETPEEDIEEERRLCYVGMTRARQKLYLSNVVVRRIWGNANFHDPSRFFEEIPANLIELRDYAERMNPGRGFGMVQPGFGAGSGGGKPSYARSFEANDFDQRVVDRPPVLSGTLSRRSQDDLVGQKLNHPEYGPGTIIAADGSGEDRKVTIEFKGRAHRKFLLRYVAAYLA